MEAHAFNRAFLPLASQRDRGLFPRKASSTLLDA